MVNQGAIWRTETLSPQTWPLFADLVERHNGVYGGCWCLGFHPETAMPGIDRRATKQQMVDEGRTHAELVLDEDGTCRGWARWGSVEELSAIKHLRAYLKDEPERPSGASPVFSLTSPAAARGWPAWRWGQPLPVSASWVAGWSR